MEKSTLTFKHQINKYAEKATINAKCVDCRAYPLKIRTGGFVNNTVAARLWTCL
jgi:hypothetical protein